MLARGSLLIGDEPFDVSDGQGGVQFTTAAGQFTWVSAYPAADSGQNIIPPNEVESLLVAAHPGKSHVALDIDSQGTVGLAEGLAAFFNGWFSGQTLAAMIEQRFRTVFQRDRTNIVTTAAKDATVGVDERFSAFEMSTESLWGVLQGADFTRDDDTDPGVSQNPEQSGAQGIIQ